MASRVIQLKLGGSWPLGAARLSCRSASGNAVIPDLRQIDDSEGIGRHVGEVCPPSRAIRGLRLACLACQFVKDRLSRF